MGRIIGGIEQCDLNSLRLSNFNCRDIITVSRYQYRMRN